MWKPNKTLIQQPLVFYYQQAIKNREELKIASKNVAMAKDDVALAQGARLPEFSLIANTGRAVGALQTSVPTRDKGFYSVGVGMTWNLFAGASTFKENEAHAAMLKEMLNKEHMSQSIQFAVDQAYYALSQAHVQLKAQQVQLTYAKNELALAKQKLAIGEIAQVDFENAKATWEKDYFSWLEARATVAIKERDLLFACGYPKDLA
jgi:outer membrane protein TolC